MCAGRMFSEAPVVLNCITDDALRERDADLFVNISPLQSMMLVAQKSVRSVAVMVLLVVTVAHCQENKRRAVTEHQLMHDRGRSIQSLKRLIWLSTAMEGLHTAQTHSSSSLSSIPGLSPALNPRSADSQSGDTNIYHQEAVERLMRNFFRPHLMELSDGEP
ncbi:hypothetical protein DPEC_G00195060 [Dallia pectoralis]|uniref:Uncharacterized protein n=1 Tax=Dallia pectoralis TaxID=75939 RepID=A0ACC2G778_DALPE|nr:hypothetical protein DPEC_G00195060 [Dallia pectoralis]